MAPHEIKLHTGQWRNVTKRGDMWRKFFFFFNKMWRHNLILYAPQFNFVCATMRHIAQQSATFSQCFKISELNMQDDVSLTKPQKYYKMFRNNSKILYYRYISIN